MKRIIYLTFYFKPDLCAGSFRNTPLAFELSEKAKDKNIIIDVYTTLPNRYSSFSQDAPEFEEFNNIRIHRIAIPSHKGGMIDQIYSFVKYYTTVINLNKGKNADLVFASSSRLFTAFLGYKLAKKFKSILYLDIRDIFVDTMNDVFKLKILKIIILPILKLIETLTFRYAKHINLISGGFKEYFNKFKNITFTYYSNGIDDEFLTDINQNLVITDSTNKKTIVYAGNIGEGQGLHKIIPQTAKIIGNSFEFIIIGDGGCKDLLQLEVDKFGLKNVNIKNPINRNDLKNIYRNADYLFLHLNDYPAFKKVLPSKVFELATFNKPILAGVAGFSANFIIQEVKSSFVFEPCNYEQLSNFLLNDRISTKIDRTYFINKYKRSTINKKMATSILYYI